MTFSMSSNLWMACSFTKKILFKLNVVTAAFLVVTCMSICTLIYAVGGDPAMVTTPGSYRQVPRKMISDRLGSVRTAGADAEGYLYEISEEGLLVGPNVNVDMRSGARPLELSIEESYFNLTVNGEDRASKELDSVVHTVGGLNVIYGDDKKVAVVWGNEILLEPVDSINYAGVFINLQKKYDPVLDEDEMSELESDVKGIKGVGFGVSGCGVIKVAVAYDNSFCARYGNSMGVANAYVRAVVSYASYILRRDTCHKIRLVHLEAHCKDARDPYRYQGALARIAPRHRPGYILSRFRKMWKKKRRHVRRNVAYLFSGFVEGSPYGGFGFLKAACSMYGYGWVESGGRILFIHEMGHTLGAEHAMDGVMQSGYTGSSVFFSGGSKEEINAYMRSAAGRCIKKGG